VRTIAPALHFQVMKVTDAGTFRFRKRVLYVADSLVDQPIVAFTSRSLSL
jgi:hypothetical protein